MDMDINKTEKSSFRLFKKWLRENTFLSDLTIELYVRYVKFFYKNYTEFNKENCILFLKERPRKYVKSALKYYAKFLGISIDFPKLKEPPKTKEFNIDREDLRKILEQVNLDEETKLIYEIAYYTGARIREILNLKVNDIGKDDDGNIVVRFKTKGNQFRKVPIPHILKEKIDNLVRQKGLLSAEPLFYTDVRAKKDVLDAKYCRLKRVLGKIKDKKIKKILSNTHNFRRALINFLLAKTGDVLICKEFVGHNKLETTMKYVSQITKKQKIQQGFEIIKEHERI